MPLLAEENEPRAAATATEQAPPVAPENRENVSYLCGPAFCARRAIADHAGRGFFVRDAGDELDDPAAPRHREATAPDLPTRYAAAQTSLPSPRREGTSGQSDQAVRRPMAHFSCTASDREVKQTRGG